VYDEAFVVAAVYNGFDRWSREASLIATNVQITKSTTLPKAKWTETGPNSKKYEGWMEDGIVFFNDSVADIKAVRKTANAIKIEKWYLQEKKSGKEKKKEDTSSARAYSTSAVNGLDTDDEQEETSLLRCNNSKRARTASTTRGTSNKHRRVSLDNLGNVPRRNGQRNGREEFQGADDESEDDGSSNDENMGSNNGESESDTDGFGYERQGYTHHDIGQRDHVSEYDSTH
jgi:hypothetical protein